MNNAGRQEKLESSFILDVTCQSRHHNGRLENRGVKCSPTVLPTSNKDARVLEQKQFLDINQKAICGIRCITFLYFFYFINTFILFSHII